MSSSVMAALLLLILFGLALPSVHPSTHARKGNVNVLCMVNCRGHAVAAAGQQSEAGFGSVGYVGLSCHTPDWPRLLGTVALHA